jgi:hypothetical protein
MRDCCAVGCSVFSYDDEFSLLDAGALDDLFLRSGEEMEKLRAGNPGDPDIIQVLTAHDERREKLGL